MRGQKNRRQQRRLIDRENGIRTHDLYVPNVALYQAELFPDEAEDEIRTRDPHHGKVMFYH